MLKEFKPRLYQETIFSTTTVANSLVVLPTGMGKTGLALLLAAHRLTKYPGSKVLVLSPTRPLSEQHYKTFKKHLLTDKIMLFTGRVSPQKRAQLWNDADVIISTPQGLENDIISQRVRLKDVSLIVFDEAHRAVGDYAYVFIGQQYQKKARHERILALTASPGHDIEKIAEVCDNLGIDDIEIRDENDPDVKPYIQDVKINWVKIEFPKELQKVHKYLKVCFKRKIRDIQGYGLFTQANPSSVTKTELLKFQSRIYAEVSSGNKHFEILKAMSLLAEAMKVQHGLELLESQGVYSLNKYLEKIQADAPRSKVRAVQNLAKDVDFRSALILAKNLLDDKIEHPKIKETKRIVLKEMQKKKETKAIIFTQYRDSAELIVNELEKISNIDFPITPKLFVGQTKKNGTGLSQKEQKHILEEFKDDEFNILVSTSVGEEGLDIPQVDLVMFYEPIPSAIRTVQRRGRTGRLSSGKVITLITKGTRDEGYRWSAHHKEIKMKRVLHDLKRKICSNTSSTSTKSVKTAEKEISANGNKTLTDFEYDNLVIYADTREKASKVIRIFMDDGVKIRLQRLDVADYVLSSRCAVELKTVKDFVDSVVDGRLLSQLRGLKEVYLRPVVIVEGTEDIYAQRKVNPKAIHGMIATITISYGITIIYTKDSQETSSIMMAMARREQEDGTKEFNPHSQKKGINLKEQQEYVISSIPGVGPGLAKQLLLRFGSVKNIINASEDELKETENLGDVKAKQIKELSEKEYTTE